MDYFLSIGGERSGPCTQFQLIERIREGALKGDELAWRKGSPEWQPLKSMEEFAPYWPLTVEQIAQADAARRLARVALDTPQPWLRFWARMVDYVWFVFALSFVVGPFLPQPEAVMEWSRQYRSWGILIGSMWPLLYTPLEAWCLSHFGTTPGKALLHIRVRNDKDEFPSFQQALRRSLLIYIKGLGLAFWFVPLFTMSYCRIRLLQTGTTSWDHDCQTRVEHGEPEVWRYLVLAALIFLILAVMVVSTLLITVK